MNLVDLALIAIVLIAAIGGFLRGFVHSILAIVVWGAAVLVTLYGVDYAGAVAEHWISNPVTAKIVAGAGLFIATLIVLTLIRHQVAAGVRHSPFGALDRTLGFVFGLAVGALLICVAYFGATYFAGPRAEWADWAKDAKTLPLVESTTAALCGLGPANVRDPCRERLGRAGPADIERQFERLTAPPTAPGATDSRPGYTDRERRGLDRLMEQSR
jgi:membrane protein required for colicin V production